MPFKKRFVRGDQATLMSKELIMAIYKSSRLRNVFCKYSSKDNEKYYKKHCTKCVSLRKKSIKLYFQNILRSISRNKNFWSTMKSFLRNISYNEIIFKKQNLEVGDYLKHLRNIMHILWKMNLEKSLLMLLVIIAFLILIKGKN